jgi:hypothetical protein
MWLSLAVAGGFEEAKKAPDELATRMTDAELTQAHALAATWKRKE